MRINVLMSDNPDILNEYNKKKKDQDAPTGEQKIVDLIPNYASQELKDLVDAWTNGTPVNVTKMSREERAAILGCR